MSRSLERAVATLRTNPAAVVRVEIDEMTVELRRVQPATGRSAAEVFAALGPWEGESYDEICGILAKARREERH